MLKPREKKNKVIRLTMKLRTTVTLRDGEAVLAIFVFVYRQQGFTTTDDVLEGGPSGEISYHIRHP